MDLRPYQHFATSIGNFMSTANPNRKKLLKYFVFSAALIFILIQFIPVDRSNPPVVKEPNWDSPKTRAFAVSACFDCHSNETKWPWYSYVAPVSWLVASDVHEGRKKFNISNGGSGESDEAAKEFQKGSMPPWQYGLMHPEAKLNKQDSEEFLKGLTATFGTEKKDKKTVKEMDSD